jgi:hypothetical protein
VAAERQREKAESRNLECRAVGSTGELGVEPVGDAAGYARVEVGAVIPSDRWIVLSRGAKLVAKDPRTTRETTFIGPARVKVCVGRREESWLASGEFESVAGAGETPGAEEWVVTPLAVVRYISANVRIAVRGDLLTVRLAGGDAFARPAKDARTKVPGSAPRDAGAGRSESEPWVRLSEAGLDVRPVRPTSPLDAARAAIDPCSHTADESAALARLILPHEPGEGGATLGETIARQVATRRLARAACAMASLRAQSLQPSQEQAQLIDAVANAERTASALPADAR